MVATEAGKLLKLQQLDVQRKKLQARSEQPAGKLVADKAEAVAKQALLKLRKAESTLEALRKQVRSGELELATLDAVIKDSSATLYSGGVTSSRELANIEHKLKLAREKHGKLEEDLLNSMQALETLQAEAVALRQRAVELAGEYKAAQASLSDELKKVRSSMEQVSQKRSAVAADIDPTWIVLYDRLTQKRSDMVAALEGTSCGACHVEAPPALVTQTNAGLKPTYCESCGRLLCVP